MIAITIANHVELAHKQNRMSRMMPEAMLKPMVEKAVAEKLRKALQEQGIEAEVAVVPDERSDEPPVA